MKKYLLIAGQQYYPGYKTDDWIGFFETSDLAEAQVTKKVEYEHFMSGPKKGQVKAERSYYCIYNSEYEWYCVVDIEEKTRELEKS